MLENLNLDGKSVVITGGGTGLGKEMTLSLAKAGANITIAARRIEPIGKVASLVKELGRDSLAIQTDATDSNSVSNMFAKSIDKFKKVDILINNAGIVREDSPKPIWEITDESWKTGIEVNLSTIAFTCLV